MDNILTNNQDSEKKLWDLCYSLYEDKSENFKDKVEEFYKYWDGAYSAPANSTFNDQKKTSCNIIKQIIETELSAILDAQFTVAVVPEVNVYADLSTIKTQSAYADILDSEVKQVLSRNRWDDMKEKVCRWGLVGGFGAIQTLFDTKDKVEGDICLSVIDPRTLRWDKYAKSMSDLTFMCYSVEMNPSVAKKQYGLNPDGSFNEEMCKKIDEMTESKGENTKGKQGGVVAIQSGETADLAYSYATQGISAGKIIKLVVMFLLDDTVYAPQTGDTDEQGAIKAEMRAAYPNGRMIVFSADKKNKLILEDKASPEGFKSLGNIDLFNPTDFDGVSGKSEVEDLMPIQDRINGTYLKIRQLISRHISAFALDKGLDIDIQEGDLVDNAIIFLDGIGREGGRVPGVMQNGTIEQAMMLLDYVERLKQEARETARLNETAINGMRQKGTSSADQVEALQESPMASIRSKQKNFKDIVVRMGEKICCLIQEYYSVQRVTRLATGIDTANGKASYVKFRENEEGRQVELLDEAGKVIQAMKIDKQWKYRVEVSAGTDMPRSRKENALFVEKLAQSGVLDMKDPDMVEIFLKAQDVPNYRAYMNAIRKKRSEAEKKTPQLKEIMTDPNLSKNLTEFLTALKFNSNARSQVLTAIGLDGTTDTLATAPAQEVSSKADVKDVVAMAPEVASRDPQKAADSQTIGAHIIAGGKS